VTLIECRPVPDRVMPFNSVWVMLPKPQAPMLVDYVSLGGESWTARLRSDGGRPMSGWPRRTDAAAWLPITGQFAQRQVAA